MMVIACVQASFDIGRAWCGADLVIPFFTDAEMAALAGRFESETHVCGKCCREIIKCLGVSLA